MMPSALDQESANLQGVSPGFMSASGCEKQARPTIKTTRFAARKPFPHWTAIS
jgi:hypothetical protein